MSVAQISLQLPESLYRRLVNTAQATRQPIDQVIVHALEVGSPPDWDDAPAEFQADLATLDRLDDDALWSVAKGHLDEDDDVVRRYRLLSERQSAEGLDAAEAVELDRLERELDRFMLRKAQAAVLLKWRGRSIPVL